MQRDWLAWYGCADAAQVCARSRTAAFGWWCVHTHTKLQGTALWCVGILMMCEQFDAVMAASGHSGFCCTGCCLWRLGWRRLPRAPRIGGVVSQRGSPWYTSSCAAHSARGQLHVASPARCAVGLTAAHSQCAWVGQDARILLVHCHKMHMRPACTLLVHGHKMHAHLACVPCMHSACAPCLCTVTVLGGLVSGLVRVLLSDIPSWPCSITTAVGLLQLAPGASRRP